MGDTTTNRGYRKPLSGDGAANLTNYWRNLADDIDADIDDIGTVYLTTVKVNTVASVIAAAANFTVTSAVARTLANGKFVHVRMTVTSANALTATSGDITDVTCGTLVAAYRPTETISTVVDGNSHSVGVCVVNTDGTISLRSFADTVAAGGGLTISFTFIRD